MNKTFHEADGELHNVHIQGGFSTDTAHLESLAEHLIAQGLARDASVNKLIDDPDEIEKKLRLASWAILHSGALVHLRRGMEPERVTFVASAEPRTYAQLTLGVGRKIVQMAVRSSLGPNRAEAWSVAKMNLQEGLYSHRYAAYLKAISQASTSRTALDMTDSDRIQGVDVVAMTHDIFFPPDLYDYEGLTQNEKTTITILPGQHDEIFINPHKIITLNDN